MGQPLDSFFSQLLRTRLPGWRHDRSVFSKSQRRGRNESIGSSQLTLAKPEFLERRAVMDVGAGMSYSTAFGTAPAAGTLGIWIDTTDVNNDGNVDTDVFIRRNSDNTISVANAASFTSASMLAVEGQKQLTPSPIKWAGVNAIEVYRTSGVSSATLISGGSGYTTTANLTPNFIGGTFLSGPEVWNGTAFISGAPTLVATLNVTSASVTGTSTVGGFAIGDIVNLTGGVGGSGATARVTAIDGTGKITAITSAASGSGYTSMPTGLSSGGTPIAGLTLTANGAVNAVSITSLGFGYATQPNITFTGGGGSGANFKGVLATPTVLGSVTVDSVANPLTMPMNVGILAFGTGAKSVSPANVTLAGVANGIQIGTGSTNATLPQTVNFGGNINTTANPSAAIEANSISPITVAAGIDTSAIVFQTFGNGGDITVTGGSVTARSGGGTFVTANGSISIGSPLTISGSLLAQSVNTSTNITFAAPVTAASIYGQAGADLVALGALTASGAGGIQLQSDTKQVKLAGNITANTTTGAVIISSPSGVGVLNSVAPAVITGQSLSITEGAAATDYTLTTNVSVFTAQNLASNVKLNNAKTLTVGTGPVTTFGDNLTINVAAGDLFVTGAITAASPTAANITLNASGNVAVSSGAVIAPNRVISLIAGGAVTATSLLNATGPNGLLEVDAGTGIDLGSNFRVNKLSAKTTTGDVTASSTSTGTLTVLNATTGAGNVSLQSTIGNLEIAGIVSTGNGSITLRSTAANISVLNAAEIASPGGVVTLKTDVNNIAINGTISTLPGGTLVLTAFDAGNGVVTNGSAVNISTGTINYTASNASTILSNPNVTYGNLAATLTKSGENLDVATAGPLNLLAVSVNNGHANVSASAGLTISGPVNVGTTKDVTLGAANGSVSGSGLITGNVLNVTAQNSATLATNITALRANITGTGDLTITERNGLQVDAGNLVVANGSVNITAGSAVAGTLNGTGSINAPMGNVTLANPRGAITLNAAANQVTGNVLVLTAQNAVAVNTSVQTLDARVTNSLATLTVNEANGLSIANATTSGGSIAIVAGQSVAGDMTGAGPVNATSSGNVTLTNSNGAITLNAVNNQVTGNVLLLTALNSVAVNTSVQTLNATVANGSATLTVNEANGLSIANATTTGGSIAIVAGQSLAGNITGAGSVNATTGNVTLTNTNGSITTTGLVTGNVLTVAAQNDATLATSVNSLAATITGPGNLTIVETNGLSIDPAGVRTNGGFVAITAGSTAAGTLNGPGAINATTGNVTLTNPNGSITTTGLVTGNVLTVAAQNDATLATSVNNLAASITGPGNLSIVETNGLSIDPAGVQTAGGFVSITAGSVQPGTLNGPGAINATTGNVTLTNTNGSITTTGLVTGDVLAVIARNDVALNTSVNNVSASVTGDGNLSLVETNGLNVTTLQTANGSISVQATGLGLAGASVNAGTSRVTLTIAGAITGTGTLRAGDLDWTAIAQPDDSNWTYTGLTADVTGPGNGIAIVRATPSDLAVYGLTTNSGNINLALTGPANLGLLGPVTAGGNSNVALNVTSGNIVGLPSGLVTGNVLDVAASGSATLTTNVASLVANVSGSGSSLTVAEQDGLNITAGTEVLADGEITLVVGTGGSGDLNLSGNVTSTSLANLTLDVANGVITGSGNLTAGNLSWTALRQPSGLLWTDANWSYSGLTANVTGAGNGITITRGGNLTIFGLTTDSGPIAITPTPVSPGDIDLQGDVIAGLNETGGNDVLVNVNGAVNSNGGTIYGRALNLTVVNDSYLSTAVDSVVATITGSGQFLTLDEMDDLTIGAAGIANPNGDVNIFAVGDIDSLGTITAVNLDVSANSAVLTTSVESLTGYVVGFGGLGLDVTQTGDLSIGVLGVISDGDPLAVTVSGGNLTGVGAIDAGQGIGDVFLNVGGGGVTLDMPGQISANLLSITAQNSSAVGTNVILLTATIQQSGETLTVTEFDDLEIDAGNVTTDGNISITAGGSINGAGSIAAGGGNVLLASNANITLDQVPGQVSGFLLEAQAIGAPDVSGDIRITTNVAELTAQSSFGSIVIDETDDLTVVGAGITAAPATGNVTVNAVGNISIAANVTGGTSTAVVLLGSTDGNVSTVPGALVFGDVLDIRANTTSTLDTSVNGLTGNITGAGDLTVTNFLDTANGTGANLAVHPSGILLSGGNLSLTLDPLGDAGLIGSGRIDTGGGDAFLTASNGSITLNAVPGQVTANELSLVANGPVVVNTTINSLVASVNGEGQSLEVYQTSADLTVNFGSVFTSNGSVTLDVATPHNLTVNGFVNTGSGNVTLNALGGFVDVPGLISADTLNVTANSTSVLNTWIGTLNADITGSGQDLTVIESDDLAIGSGHVRTNGGNIALTMLAGNLTGAGSVVAGGGDVLLDASAGGITLNAVPGQVAGNVLVIVALDDVAVNTGVAALAATINGLGNLTVRETNGLSIDPAGVTTAGGFVSITAGSLLPGTLNGPGAINATKGNVTLTNTNGSITTTGLVTGSVLNVVAQNDVALSTSVTNLAATITGPGNLSIVEANGLSIDPAGVKTAGGFVSITAGSALPGTLNGPGAINATMGNVTLTNPNGSITTTGLVTGNVLNVVAQNDVTLATSVNNLAATITGPGNLSITETNGLSIDPAGVKTAGGFVSITAGSALPGTLNGPGAINATTGNVTLVNTRGAIVPTGLVTGNVLTLLANGSVAVNTSVNGLVANVTGPGQSLSVLQSGKDLTVAAGAVRTNNGPLTLAVAAPYNLTVTGGVAAGAVTLNAAGGFVNAPGLISADTLTVTANATSALNTAINTLNANITGPGQNLTVTEADSLTIGSGNVRTNNGNISITTSGGGSLVRMGAIDAGTAHVALKLGGGTSGTGVVTAAQLTLNAVMASAVNTNVGTLVANITGPGQPLTVNESSSLLMVGSDIATTNGAIAISLATGSLTGTGRILAGSGNVTLNATAGAVTLDAVPGQIVGNVLSVRAAASTTLNTNVGTLVANITGPGQSLTVNEMNSLLAVGSNVTTNSGNVAITLATGSLGGTGSILAGTGNVTLTAAAGAITLNAVPGQVAGNQLTLVANGTTSVNTSVNTLVADITGTAQTLAVTEVNGLSIGAAGVRTKNGGIALTAGAVSTGTLSGTGTIDAGTSNISLANPNGGIVLTSVAGQVVGNVATINVADISAVNTNVSTVSGSISRFRQGLYITQTNAIKLGALTANNGTISVTAAGGIGGTGTVGAGNSGVVVLNAAAGAVTLIGAGQVAGGSLTVTARDTSTVGTAANTLAAKITGAGQSLTVNEADGVGIGAAGVSAGGGITLNLATGSLNGSGPINAGAANVTLTALAGGLAPTGTITGKAIAVRAALASSLRTNVDSLTAALTTAGQGLAVNETNGLAITAGNVTSVNGPVAIALASGNLTGPGRINTGTAAVTLQTTGGRVTLTDVPNQVTGGALTLRAFGTSAVNTSVVSLDAVISGTGTLTVNEANGLTVTQARTANGQINLTATPNSIVNVVSVNAGTGLNGNLTITNGYVYVQAPGIVGTNTVDLRATQGVTIVSGTITAPIVLLPGGPSPALNWQVSSSADAGPGSIRDVIARINAAGPRPYTSTIVVSNAMTVNLLSPLPAMTQQMNFAGNNLLTLDGTSAGRAASGFTITSTSVSRSTISGVTFRRFGGAGIDLVGARNISVTRITVTDSGIGFRASGNLAGSGVFGSTFTNDVVGGVLLNAQNFRVGVNPLTGALAANTFTGGPGFRGASTTGISLSGVSTGTQVKANRFDRYPTAISIVGATNVLVGGPAAGEGNVISNAVTAGIYATGFCQGSSVVKTTFGAGVVPSKQYVVSTSRNLVIVR